MTPMTTRSLPPSAGKETGMTDKQIDKIRDVLVAVLRKCRKAFRSADVQVVLGRKDLTKRLVEVIVATIKQLAEEVSGVIVRTTIPYFMRTPQEMLLATSRKQYVNDEVVAIMPVHGKSKVNLEFVNFGKYMSDDALEAECKLRGYQRIATPFELGAVNEADSAFADTHPNATHWKDAQGKWCYIAFIRLDGERDVGVDRLDNAWHAFWWFAFVR